MPRSYPRFLFSNPKNVKTEGPYIVHLLQPKRLYKVHWLMQYPDFQLVEIPDWGDTCSLHEQTNTMKDATRWLDSQIKTKAIAWGI